MRLPKSYCAKCSTQLVYGGLVEPYEHEIGGFGGTVKPVKFDKKTGKRIWWQSMRCPNEPEKPGFLEGLFGGELGTGNGGHSVKWLPDLLRTTSR